MIMMFIKNTSVVLLTILIISQGILFSQEDKFSLMRQKMVEQQLLARDITDKSVISAMREVPRHLFVDEKYRHQAYQDHPLPIDEGQTISQPYIVALMTQCLELKKGDKILEIGTGSGYQAAVLACLTDRVFSVEIRKNLAEKAKKSLRKTGYDYVKVKWGDGYFGWEEHAPYDAIIVTCAANHIPPPLMKQLKEGGRLVIPLGSTLYFQTLTKIIKKGGNPRVEHILGVRFVPMVGEVEKK